MTAKEPVIDISNVLDKLYFTATDEREKGDKFERLVCTWRRRTDDIAEHLGVTKHTVYAWVSDRGMPAHKVGRLRKSQTSEVDQWVRGNGVADGAA